MANKIPWIRFYLYDWNNGTDGMTPEQRGIYVTLLIRMYDKKSPVKEDFKTLARVCNCTEKKFATVVDYLIKNDKLIQTDEGLWNLRVEEELKDFTDRQEHISQVRSEAGKKGVQAKTLKKQFANDFVEANDKQNQANQNQNHIYKKTNTIVLSKKETALEDLATEVSVQDETTDATVEKHLDHGTLPSENQSPVSEQKSTEKKTKRPRGERGCRLPEDFEPDYDFAIQEGLPPERVKVEIAKFRDYWRSSASPNAIKKDWQATWRNWVRKAIENLEKGNSYGKPSIEYTKQQRGWNYRVAQHMSNIKTSDNVYKFLFEDDERTAVPLEDGTKTIDCRSEESYLIGP